MCRVLVAFVTLMLVSITPTTGAYARSKVNTDHRRRATLGYHQAMPGDRAMQGNQNSEGNEFGGNDPAQFFDLYTAAFSEAGPTSKWFAEYYRGAKKFASTQKCEATRKALVDKFGACGTISAVHDTWLKANCGYPTGRRRSDYIFASRDAPCSGKLVFPTQVQSIRRRRQGMSIEDYFSQLNRKKLNVNAEFTDVTVMQHGEHAGKEFRTFTPRGINTECQQCSMRFDYRLEVCSSCNATECPHGMARYFTSSTDTSSNTSSCGDWFLSAMTTVSGFGNIKRKDMVLKYMRKCEAQSKSLPGVGSVNSGECPPGTEQMTTKEECSSAAVKNGKGFNREGIFGGMPLGCYENLDNNMYYFNKYTGESSGNKDAKPVCIPPLAGVGSNGSGDCPPDTKRMTTKEECASAAERYGKQFNREGTFKWMPLGCYENLGNNMYYFNIDQSSNAGREGAKPVCIPQQWSTVENLIYGAISTEDVPACLASTAVLGETQRRRKTNLKLRWDSGAWQCSGWSDSKTAAQCVT